MCNYEIAIDLDIASWVTAGAETVLAFAAWKALNELTQHRKKQASDAAIRALALVSAYADYINEIVAKRQYYEVEGYYPGKIPEVLSKTGDVPCYPERPARLIYNRHEEFRKDFNEQVAHIGGKIAKALLEELSKIQEANRSLSHSIGAQGVNTEEIARATYSNIEESRKKIEQSCNKICEILDAILK